MTNPEDFNSLISVFEEEAIIAAPQPEPSLRRLELLYIAIARSEKSINAMQNLNRSISINSAKVRTRFN